METTRKSLFNFASTCLLKCKWKEMHCPQLWWILFSSHIQKSFCDIRTQWRIAANYRFFCFTYLQMDCLYAAMESLLSSKNETGPRKGLFIVQRALHSNQQNREVDVTPGIAKKRFLIEKYKETIWAISRAKNQRKLTQFFFQNILNKLKRVKMNWKW